VVNTRVAGDVPVLDADGARVAGAAEQSVETGDIKGACSERLHDVAPVGGASLDAFGEICAAEGDEANAGQHASDDLGQPMRVAGAQLLMEVQAVVQVGAAGGFDQPVRVLSVETVVIVVRVIDDFEAERRGFIG
jgi:hypothetical protein